MSQVNVWLCAYKNCKVELNEIENHWNSKYCKGCLKIMYKEKCHNTYLRRKKEGVSEAYALTNVQ